MCNFVVAAFLVDFDDIDYEQHADLLYDLATQTVAHFKGYLSEDDATKVLQCHRKEIANFIHAQMQEHYWEDEEVEYEVVVSKGFTELKSSAYTAPATSPTATALRCSTTCAHRAGRRPPATRCAST